MSAITLSAVDKSFGTTEVLRGLDLAVPDGAVVAVLGESGSGKTTLLRLVAGTERADAGAISIGGRRVDDGGVFVPPERRGIGYVAQEGALFPHLTAARNIAFGLSRAERSSGRVEELLELVGMAGYGRRWPHELSGGQQQRVALARALAPRPAVVLLDEPFSALDASLRASLRADVMQILRAAGMTTVLVTHDQEEALSVADLLGVMSDGQIRQLAPPDEVYARPADAAVAAFLGEANLVGGRARAGQVETPYGVLRLSPASSALEGAVIALIRPEQLALGPAGARAGASGRVVHREYYGHDSVFLISEGERPEPLRVRLAGHAAFEIGAEVSVLASGETVAWPAGEATARAGGPPSAS